MSCCTNFSCGRVRSRPKPRPCSAAYGIPGLFTVVPPSLQGYRLPVKLPRSKVYSLPLISAYSRTGESSLFRSTEISTLLFWPLKFLPTPSAESSIRRINNHVTHQNWDMYCHFCSPRSSHYIYTHSFVPPSQKKSNSRFRIRHIFLSLIKDIENNINIYVSK
jgi:TATA-binding protein-associated factor Taf7